MLNAVYMKSKIVICMATRGVLEMVIYTAAVPEPDWLYTLLPGINVDGPLQSCHSRARLAIYTAAGHQCKMVLYTAAVPEPDWLYTLLPGINVKWSFTELPFQSQIGYIHCCRASM